MLTSGGRYAGGSAQDPAEGGEDTATQAYWGGGTLIYLFWIKIFFLIAILNTKRQVFLAPIWIQGI